MSKVAYFMYPNCYYEEAKKEYVVQNYKKKSVMKVFLILNFKKRLYYFSEFVDVCGIQPL